MKIGAALDAFTSSRTEQLSPEILLAEKFEGVRCSGDTLARPRLTDVLARARGNLVLLAAPPGFGKTTLLSQWRDCDARAFACLSLDAGDNDPVVLWTYIVEALQRVAPGFGSASLAALRTPGVDVLRTVVPLVLSELEAVRDEVVLVLDDYQVLEHHECHDLIAFFLERTPPTVTLALSSRADPPIAIGRLRALGELVELRAADLSFTEEEEAAFLNETLSLELPPRALRTLHKRTEGWPVGLSLAAISIQNAPDGAAFVARFNGANRHVVDYLTEVTLNTLDLDRRRFLLETSVLGTMCGPLCDAATGRTGSAELLADVERANLFLVPLDDQREWYRYHRLFAEVLQNQLWRNDPEHAREINRRSSKWLAGSGHTSEAIRHALDGEDIRAALEIVWNGWRPSFHVGEAKANVDRLAALPAATVERDARLSLVKAWAMSVLNRRDEAHQALEAVEMTLPEAQSRDRNAVQWSTALLRACFPRGDAHRMLTAAQGANDLPGESATRRSPAALLVLGYAWRLAGELERARSALSGALLAAGPREWYILAAAQAGLARLALETGAVDSARGLARDAVELAETRHLSGQYGAGMIYVALAEALAHGGETDEAEQHLEHGLTNLRAGGEELYLADGLLVSAPLRRARGAPGEARAILSEARAIIERCPDPGNLGQRLEEVARTLTPAHRRIQGDSELTERELEVLRYLAEGLTKREIGNLLFLSFNTIHSHTKSIYQKLRVSSRQAAVKRAHELGAL